jgi:hypothetical protein
MAHVVNDLDEMIFQLERFAGLRQGYCGQDLCLIQVHLQEPTCLVKVESKPTSRRLNVKMYNKWVITNFSSILSLAKPTCTYNDPRKHGYCIYYNALLRRAVLQ